MPVYALINVVMSLKAVYWLSYIVYNEKNWYSRMIDVSGAANDSAYVWVARLENLLYSIAMSSASSEVVLNMCSEKLDMSDSAASGSL